MSDRLNELRSRCDSVVIFRGLGNDPVISDLMYLISANPAEASDFVRTYGDFAESLYKETVNLSEYILKAVLEDDNFYIRLVAKGEKPDPLIVECVVNELELFQLMSQLAPEDFADELDYDGFLPRWKTAPIDLIGSYNERLRLISRYGYGQFARYKMFMLNSGGLSPVEYPDTQRLSELYGYENERKAVIDNTLALLDGRPAQNALLYGDAGTGKSSTVKAIVNEYADRGLRLIELTKEQLREIPRIIDEISCNPLKFIIFIDDLSFTADEDCFGALKAALEGSVSARADNTVIYATSNRRHLVRESFSDRDGDDVHRNDTMQEMLSLSARFGLRVNFRRPDKKSYVAIAAELAKQNCIAISEEELSLKAEQFAMQGNGRSPRTAKQFVNQLLNENLK